MSTSRRSSTARRSARLSWASASCWLEDMSRSPRPRIWRSSSLTMLLVASRWRSMLRSSAPASRTWLSSFSCSWRGRAGSARISSRRRRLASISEGGFCACKTEGRKDGKTESRSATQRRGVGLTTVHHLPSFRLSVFPSLNMAKMPSDAQEAPHQPDQRPEHHHQAELERAEEHQAAAHLAGGLPEDLQGEAAHEDRQAAAQQALEGAFEEEGTPDEPVGGADQAHDGDLPRALQHGDPDGDADDDDGHDGEREPDHQADRGREVAEPVEPLDPVAPEADVVHEGVRVEPLRDQPGVLGVAEFRLETDLERGGERIGLQVAIRLLELDQLAPGPGEGLVLAHVADLEHLGKRLHVGARRGDRLGGGAAQDEGHHLHPLGKGAERLAEIEGHQPEEADREEGEPDRRDREGGEQGGAPEGAERLAHRGGGALAAQGGGGPPAAPPAESSSPES